MTENTCKEFVYRPIYATSGVCGRPSKPADDNPKGLCGIHLAAVRRRTNNQLKMEQEERDRRAQAIVNRTRLEAAGITEDDVWYVGSSPSVTIPITNLIALVERARAEGRS